MDSNKLKCKNTKEYIYNLANNNLCHMTISPKLAIVYIGNNKALGSVRYHREIFDDMVKEAFVNLSVSCRTEQNILNNPEFYAIYFLANLYVMEIYFKEKKIVAPPLMENVIKYFKMNKVKKFNEIISKEQFDNCVKNIKTIDYLNFKINTNQY